MRLALEAFAILMLVGGCNRTTPAQVSAGKALPYLAGGQEIFERVFTDSTGLGDVNGRFNGTSCAECHNHSDDAPILGGPGDEIERHQVGAFCAVQVLHELPSPEVATGEIGLRDSNDLFGLGHLDQLTDLEIITYATHEPRFLGYIDGVYWYNSPQINLINGQVGRFGRKAEARSLDEFVRGALRNEIGVEPDVEIPEDQVGALVGFVSGIQRPLAKISHLAAPPFGFKHFTIPPGHAKGAPDSIVVPPPSPPPDSTPDGSLVTTGRALFKTIGCAVCHNPATEYTDLALHNLGESDICNKPPDALALEPGARAEEFRTEPLVGVGLQTRFMHDGASATLLDAISRHGKEAGYSRAQFNHLNDRDNSLRDIGQASILAFLRSL